LPAGLAASCVNYVGSLAVVCGTTYRAEHKKPRRIAPAGSCVAGLRLRRVSAEALCKSGFAALDQVITRIGIKPMGFTLDSSQRIVADRRLRALRQLGGMFLSR